MTAKSMQRASFETEVRSYERADRTGDRRFPCPSGLAVLREQGNLLPQGALARVVNEVSDAVVGMGPIEFLFKDPDVSEVTRANAPTWSYSRTR
jgi:hypothetical protein